MFLFLLSLIVAFTSTQVTPPTTFPNLVVSSCNVDSDCPIYLYPACISHQCGGCYDDNQCNHIPSSPQCSSSLCPVSCSATDYLDCWKMRIRCDEALGRCRHCHADSDCDGFPTPIWCQSQGNVNFCVSCRDDNDCDSGWHCNNLRCQQCNSDTDCPASNPACYQTFAKTTCLPCLNSNNAYCKSYTASKCVDKTCTTCTGPSDCTHITGRPICSSGKCVECTSSTQCTTSSKPYCNPTSGLCEVCRDSNDCTSFAPGQPDCSSTLGCVQCADSSLCSTAALPYCKTDEGLCKTCRDSNDCTKFSTTKVCNGAGGCVECTDDDDCTTPAKSICNLSTKTCKVCLGDPDCAKFPTKAFCSSGGCVGCSASYPCLTVAKSYCDTSDTTCKPCRNSGDCTHLSATPVCTYPASPAKCVQCTTTATDCLTPAKSYCNTGTNLCQICADDTQCAHLTSTTICISSGCVQCTSNTHCMSTTSSFCNPALHQCKPCTVNSQCTHIPGMNMCWQGECVQYSNQCSPIYIIKIVQEIPLTIFSVTFPADLVSKVNIPQDLQIKLAGIDKIYYEYSLTSTSATDYQIIFVFKKTIPKTTLSLELPCPTQPGKRFGNIKVSIKTLKIAYSTPGLASTMETIVAVAQTAATSVGAISGAMMFIGANPAILWGLIGLLQTFYYMIFINVQYPANVEAFFPVFSIGNLDFLPNPMWIIFSNIDDFSLPVPQKFADYEVDGLFLANAGNMLLLWGLNLMIFSVSYLILRYTRNMPPLLTKGCSKTVNIFMWSGTVRTFITSFMEISIASFLQMRVLTFSSGLFSASSISGILFCIFSLSLPMVAFKIVQIYDTDPLYVTRKFGTLIEEYKQNDDIHKYFTVIALGKNLIFAASLVYLHDYPYTEIITIISITFSYAYLLCKYRPFESKVASYANFLSEAVFGIIYLFIFILIHDDYSPAFSDDTRINIGWGIILGCGIILMASIVIALAEQYSVIKNMIIMLKAVLKKGQKSREERSRKFRRKIKKASPEAELSRDPSIHTDHASLITGRRDSPHQKLKLSKVKKIRNSQNKSK